MIGLDALGFAAAALPAAVAVHHSLDRASPTRWRNAAFWGVFAVLLGPGVWLPDLVAGMLVLVLVGLATWGCVPRPSHPMTRGSLAPGPHGRAIACSCPRSLCRS
ncbi:DUF979 family protein [Sphingomonas sp. I4]